MLLALLIAAGSPQAELVENQIPRHSVMAQLKHSTSNSTLQHRTDQNIRAVCVVDDAVQVCRVRHGASHLTSVRIQHSTALRQYTDCCLHAGLFLAPQMVGEALKGGRLIAEAMSRAGYPCTPMQGLPPTHSFITAVHLGSPAKMTAFCRAVQNCCPVGSYIQPIPGTLHALTCSLP